MKFIYVKGQDNKDKMIAMGYKLLKANSRGDLFIFKNKDEALKFSSELEHLDYVTSDVLTF